MSILSFVGHILKDVPGKNDNCWQIHKQTNSTFYSSNAMCVENNMLRRKKILAMTFLYYSVAIHTSANAQVITI